MALVNFGTTCGWVILLIGHPNLWECHLLLSLLGHPTSQGSPNKSHALPLSKADLATMACGALAK